MQTFFNLVSVGHAKLCTASFDLILVLDKYRLLPIQGTPLGGAVAIVKHTEFHF